MGSGKLLALVHSFRRTNTHLALQEEMPGAAAGRSFETDLAERMQQLQLQGGGGSAHLNWLLDACAATLSTHSSLASLIRSSSEDTDHQSLQFPAQRADEMLGLLDVCTSLKQMTDDVDRQLSLLQRALQIAEQALRAPQTSVAKLQGAAHRLRACLNGIQVHKDSKQSRSVPDAHAALLLTTKRLQGALFGSDPLNQALDGTLLISLLVLASAVASFVAPSKCGATRSVCKLIARYASKGGKNNAPATWVYPLRQLQHDLQQEEMSAVFLELQSLHASVPSLLGAITAVSPDTNFDVVRRSIHSLRKRSEEAQACISTLRSHLTSVFQTLLALRLALLH